MVRSVLIVGAGFAGAVHARELAEHGFEVDLIDRRPHIAGNAFDFIDQNGVRVHKYGPHLFHTNNEPVFRWLKRFAAWVPYEHRVKARLGDGRRVPLPINRETINAVFGLNLRSAEEVQAFLATQSVPNDSPRNAAEFLASNIGTELTDIFFRSYTRTMWALDLEDMDASVVKRIPLRYDSEDRYFPGDRFQAMPENGYTALFHAILDHPSIRIYLNQAFSPEMRSGYAHCFTSAAIDEYFDNVFGPLPYRSIRFHHRTEPPATGDRFATLNFTEPGPLTRETDWGVIPGHAAEGSGPRTITSEEPCDYRANEMERYYPIKTSDDRYSKALVSYRDLAAQDSALTFIGRCGTYQYLDMHQVINQSLVGVTGWLRQNPAR